MRFLALVVIAGALAASAMAAATHPTLVATPSSVTAGDSFVVTGCGYTNYINAQVVTPEVDINGNHSGFVYLAVPDANGCINVDATTITGVPGTYNIQAWQTKPNGSRGKLLASTSVQAS